jgi:hypothetical protein
MVPEGFTSSQITYDKWHEVDLKFSAISVTSDFEGCPVSYWLVNELDEQTSETQAFELGMTFANGGSIAGKITLADAAIKTWRIKATIGNMLSATPIEITANNDNVFPTLEWNFVVVDACAQPGVLASKMANGVTNLFEGQHWVGDDQGYFRFDNYDAGDCGAVTLTLVDENQSALSPTSKIELVAADAAVTFKAW